MRKATTTKPNAKLKHGADIREVAKDIISIKFKRTDTIEMCDNMFFSIMKKHGIKQGTPTLNKEGKEVGRACDNFEWTLCMELYTSELRRSIQINMLFGDVIPKELLK